VASYETPAWINTIVTEDIDEDGEQEIILGCNEIQYML